MLQAFFWRGESLEGRVEIRALGFISRGLVGVRELTFFGIGRLEELRIEGGCSGKTQRGKGVHAQAAKLSPQEQVTTAFGFFTLKPPLWRSSL